jgi:hypothetical protein
MITPVFKKLNFKDQSAILIQNAPDSFKSEVKAISVLAAVSTAAKSKHDFLLFFVSTLKEINTAVKVIEKNKTDAVIWFAYPKQSSKKHTCEFNRDTGWQVLGDIGLEPVRQVAIDEDWSALRFKKPEQIKKMIRRESMTLTKAGKEKTINKSGVAIKENSPLPALLKQVKSSEISQMFGKPCLKLNGKAFAAWHQECMIFKLKGEEREEILKLKGAKMWDPSGKSRPMKEWIQLEQIHEAHFKKLVVSASKNAV